MAKVKKKEGKKCEYNEAIDRRRALFINEYMVDRNATQAAIRAGYSAKTACAIGSRLLRNVNIMAEIERRVEECAALAMITPERIMREYARIAFADTNGMFNKDGTMKTVPEMHEDIRRSINSVDAVGGKIKLSDKRGALDSLAKIMGIMKEKVEVSVVDTATELDAARDRINGKKKP